MLDDWAILVTALLLMNRPHAYEGGGGGGQNKTKRKVQIRVGSGVSLTEADRRITDLVERRHEAGVVVEGRHDQGVVLLVDVQSGLDVDFRVLEETQRG